MALILSGDIVEASSMTEDAQPVFNFTKIIINTPH